MSEPLTDEELVEIEQEWEADSVHRRTPSVPRLIAEVRRLRSDEWLEKAAGEIHRDADRCAPDETVSEAEVLFILRKHRDGKG